MMPPVERVRRAAESIAAVEGFDEAERRLEAKLDVLEPNREGERNAIENALFTIRRQAAAAAFLESVATDGGTPE